VRPDAADKSDGRFLVGLPFNLRRSRRLLEDASIRGIVLASLDVLKHCISLTIRKLLKKRHLTANVVRVRAEGSAHYAEIAACALETVLQNVDKKRHAVWTAEPI
jgi:hypothetical protein